MKNFVKTFPMAFVRFFNVYETVQSILGLGHKGREVDILKNFRGVAKPGRWFLCSASPDLAALRF